MVVNIYERSDLIPIATIDYFPGREAGYVKLGVIIWKLTSGLGETID